MIHFVIFILKIIAIKSLFYSKIKIVIIKVKLMRFFECFKFILNIWFKYLINSTIKQNFYYYNYFNTI